MIKPVLHAQMREPSRTPSTVLKRTKDATTEMAIKQHKKYPLTKSWFVGVYKNFNVEDAQKAINAHLIALAAAPIAASAQYFER